MAQEILMYIFTKIHGNMQVDPKIGMDWYKMYALLS